MNNPKENEIKHSSISEFSSSATQQEFEEVALRGFWESEKKLVEEYFLPNTKILDIGCGSGRTTIPLHEAGYDVVGIDITPPMIETARNVAQSKKLDIDYLVGDATQLEFKDGTFSGAIFANNGWAQIPGKSNRQKAIDEAYRVLEIDGVFILTSHVRYFTMNTILFWFSQWVQYRVLAKFGFRTEGAEFGDIFFERKHDKTQKQFIHMAGRGDVSKQLQKAGFEVILEKRMGEISPIDASYMRGSLNKSFNSFKSPVFYICRN